VIAWILNTLIRQAIEEHTLTTVEDVAEKTEAGYCCGGCGDDIQEIVNEVTVSRKAGEASLR
jgi:bacterioferritin-associated ferredoxin